MSRTGDPASDNGQTDGHSEAKAATITDLNRRKKLAEARAKEAEAEARERRNRIAEGDYIPREDVNRFFAAFFTRLRDDLARIPLEMRGSFPKDLAVDLERQLKSRHDLLLRTLYNQRDRIGAIERAE